MFEKSKEKMRTAKAKAALARGAIMYASEPTVENESKLRRLTEDYTGRQYDSWTDEEKVIYENMLSHRHG